MFQVLVFEDEWTYDIEGCYETIEEANEAANHIDTECDIWICTEEELDQFNEDLQVLYMAAICSPFVSYF